MKRRVTEMNFFEAFFPTRKKISDGAESEEMAEKGNEEHVVDLLLGAIRAVAPLSVAVLVYKVGAFALGHHRHLLVSSRRRVTLFNVWIVLETLFLFYVGKKKSAAQRHVKPHDSFSFEDRAQLLQRAFSTVDDPRKFMSEWTGLPFEKIKYGNVEEWLSWGLFGVPSRQLNKEELNWVHNHIPELEKFCKTKFKPGQNGRGHGLMVTLQPAEGQHRPLLYYAIVQGFLQVVMVPLTMTKLGFSRKAVDEEMRFWHRRAKRGSTVPPLVIFHGIGVGILPYYFFLRDIIRRSSDTRDIVMVELPIVSQQITPSLILRHEYVHKVPKLLDVLGAETASFVGHSYGSFILSWIVQDYPELCHSLTLIDPVSIFLHYTTSVKNILYKQADDDHFAERLAFFIFRSDVWMNIYFRRYATWYYNILFLDDIPSTCPTLIALSDRDDVLPLEPVKSYVEKYMETNPNIELCFMTDCDHGEVVFHHRCREQLIRVMIKTTSQKS